MPSLHPEEKPRCFVIEFNFLHTGAVRASEARLWSPNLGDCIFLNIYIDSEMPIYTIGHLLHK